MAAFPETLGKIALGSKTRKLCYFGDAVIGGFQQFFADLEPPFVKVADGRQAVSLGKGVNKIIFIQMGQGSQGV